MAIYELAKDTLIKVEPTSFEAERLKERQDIQRLLMKLNHDFLRLHFQ